MLLLLIWSRIDLIILIGAIAVNRRGELQLLLKLGRILLVIMIIVLRKEMKYSFFRKLLSLRLLSIKNSLGLRLLKFSISL